MSRIQRIDKREINKLVKAIGSGDENAFNLLYSKMKKVLYYFLLRENTNKDYIEDIISSTFLIVIEKSKSKMFYKNCFSWILTIAKYQLLSFNRKQEKVLFNDESINRCGIRINSDSFSLKFEIEQLDAQSQKILYFVYYEHLTYFEISKILNISVSTIKRRKSEIINHLKEKYNEKY